MDDFDSLAAQVRETSTFQTTTKEAYAELFQRLLRDSIKRNASHIHVEHTSSELVIRYRIQSKLQLRCILPRKVARGVIDAIKLHCGMDLPERRRPQDGRAIYPTDDSPRTLRVSVVPAVYGQTAVLTWQVPDLKCRALHELGLLPDQEDQVKQMLQSRLGFISISGSTGHGKRTFGHAIAMMTRDIGKEVISLESRMTRFLPGILQWDLYDSKQLTPVEWIRAALGRRPEVLFIDHPYEPDTIREVIAAARNTCLVIATMTRSFDDLIHFLEWRAEVRRPTSVETVLGAIEQQLLPAVCHSCTTYYTPNAAELQELRIRCANPERLSFARARGCLACRDVDRTNSVGVHEVATMTDCLRQMFLQQKDESIRQHLLDCGMVTFYQSAIHKLVTKQISSATVFFYGRHFYREPKGWINVDPDTGLVNRALE